MESMGDRGASPPPRVLTAFRAYSELDAASRFPTLPGVAKGKDGKTRGRNLKLTPENIAKLCGQIKKGNLVITAVKAVGISYSTFYAWREQGEKDRKAGKRGRYVEFLEEVEHAEAVGEQRLIKNVLEKGGWKGSLEILKRRYRKDWGDKTALTKSDGTDFPVSPIGAPAVNLTINTTAPPDDNPFTGHGTGKPEPAALPGEEDTKTAPGPTLPGAQPPEPPKP